MAKKSKPKKKGQETNEDLSLNNPCGDYCDVGKGQLCPECADWSLLQGEADDESAEGEVLKNLNT